MASTMMIGTIPQWQLFQSVSPVFQSDLKWEARDPQQCNNAIVRDWTKQFSLRLREIPFHIDPETELDSTKRAIFAWAVGTLLSSIQNLVADAIPQDFGYYEKWEHSSLHANDVLLQWPRLLGLAYLVENDLAWSDYIILRHDPHVFHDLKTQLEMVIMSRRHTITESEPSPSQAAECQDSIQDSIVPGYHCFVEYSKRVFNVMLRYTQKLEKCTSTHKALLHLKGPSDAHDHENTPELSMFLACCPEQNTWQQVVCSECVSDDQAMEVADICYMARCCFHDNYIFKVEVMEDKLLNASDDFMDEKPSRMDNSSLAECTLGQLLRRGVFERYGVFPNDRKILAYHMARALLCLYDGPWLQAPWTADRLVFRYDATVKTIYNMHQPYISCDFNEDRPPITSKNPALQYPMIQAFAGVLIDLDRGSTDEGTDIANPAFFRNVKMYYDENNATKLSPGYGQALHSCIYFSKHWKNIHRKNPKATIQDAILAGIVRPLEKDVHMDMKHKWDSANVHTENDVPVMAPPTLLQDPTPIQEPHIRKQPMPKQSVPLTRLQKSQPTSSAPARNERNGFGRGTQRASLPQSGRQRAGSRLASGSTSPGSAASDRLRPKSPRQQLASRSLSPNQSTIPRSLSRPVTPRDARISEGRPAEQTRSLVAKEPVGQKHTKAPSCSSTTKTAISISTTKTRIIPQVRLNGGCSGPADGYGSMSPDDAEANPGIASGSFGARMFSVSTSGSAVSTATFRNMNAKVDDYLQHTEDDTPIKVAVIDTGIDLDHADFQHARTKQFRGPAQNEPNPVKYELPQRERIKAYKNFCKDQPEDNVSDLDGHGTQVAGIILRLAPNAELYVARVCTGDINYGLEADKKQKMAAGMVATPEMETVQQAIQWALSNDVDIINLSLGYRNATFTQFGEITRMLRDSHRTIVFAATSNEGGHDLVAWPARDQDLAIGIHSCCDTGTKPSDFSAHATDERENFMTVGENILSQWPTSKGGGFHLCSGTSFATPVAVAVGALVLQFVQQESQVDFRRQAKQAVDLESLHSTAGMRKVLCQISTKDSNNYRWIHSKLLWHEYRDNGQQDKAFRHAWDVIERAFY